MRLPKRKRKGKGKEEATLPPLPEHVTLTPLAATAGAFRFPGVLAAELRLALKGQPWWWYAAAAGLMFSAPHPVGRQLPAVWMAGVLVAAVVGGGVAVRYLIGGDFAALAGWTVGALFIPSLALALGVWSGSSKLFEAVYLFLWYIGPMNRTPELDYLGATGRGQPLVWLAVTALLAAAAATGRRWQLHRD